MAALTTPRFRCTGACADDRRAMRAGALGDARRGPSRVSGCVFVIRDAMARGTGACTHRRGVTSAVAIAVPAVGVDAGDCPCVRHRQVQQALNCRLLIDPPRGLARRQCLCSSAPTSARCVALDTTTGRRSGDASASVWCMLDRTRLNDLQWFQHASTTPVENVRGQRLYRTPTMAHCRPLTELSNRQSRPQRNQSCADGYLPSSGRRHAGRRLDHQRAEGCQARRRHAPACSPPLHRCGRRRDLAWHQSAGRRYDVEARSLQLWPARSLGVLRATRRR